MSGYIRPSPTHDGQEVTGGNSVLSMPATTFAGLGSAVTAGNGARGFVTDATLPLSSTSIATNVVGGGANRTPVYSDGTAWKFG